MARKQKIDKNSYIRNCNLSVRTHNVLYSNSEAFGVPRKITATESNFRVLDIGKLSLREIGTFRNCGKKTLSEIKELCQRTRVVLKQ